MRPTTLASVALLLTVASLAHASHHAAGLAGLAPRHAPGSPREAVLPRKIRKRRSCKASSKRHASSTARTSTATAEAEKAAKTTGHASTSPRTSSSKASSSSSSKISSHSSSKAASSPKVASSSKAASSSSSAADAATSLPDSTSLVAATSPFTLTQNYNGSTFLNGFDFFTQSDPTGGMVNFVDASTAWSNGLVSTTSAGNTILKVDDSTWLASGANRNSVRITSKETFSLGSLVLLDAVSMPHGPSVWPAFWSVGDDWPQGGEIDIVEQVQDATQNQYTLHTNPGCTLSQPMLASGEVLVDNCDATIDNNQGCGVLDKSTKSYGSGFNAAGGGVFAMHWAASGISIWFFTRDAIPADITSEAPAFTEWGEPSASWASSTCDMTTMFGPQTLVFDITLCGDWAGTTYNQFYSTGNSCSSAVEDPTNFVNAAFEIASVKVYTPK